MNYEPNQSSDVPKSMNIISAIIKLIIHTLSFVIGLHNFNDLVNWASPKNKLLFKWILIKQLVLSFHLILLA